MVRDIMLTSRALNVLILAVTGLALWLTPGASARAELLRAGGTGAAMETLRRLGAAFTKIEPDTKIEVIEGLGSSGAIAAVAAGAIDIAVSGRPLAAADDRTLKGSIFGRTPFCLASSHPKPGNVRSVDVADFMSSPASVWPDGKPVRLILRPRSDTDAQLLVSTFPNMAVAMEKVRQRSEIPVAATDQDNAKLAENLAGSLTAMTLAQIQTEKLRLNLMGIDGIVPTLEAFEGGKYPYGKDLHLIVPSRTKPVLDRFIAFVRSLEGRRILRASAILPVEQ